jgi:hypothetical protein
LPVSVIDQLVCKIGRFRVERSKIAEVTIVDMLPD